MNLLISVLLHSILVASFFFLQGTGSGNSDSNDKGGNGGADILDVDIIPKPDKSKNNRNVPEPEEGIPLQNYKTHYSADGSCDHYYGGIGIQYDSFTNEVKVVFKGYPADLNGIKEGDIIECERGEPGSTAHVVIHRDDQIIVKDIVRDKICFKQEKE